MKKPPCPVHERTSPTFPQNQRGSGFSQTISLFHGLAGLCAGFGMSLNHGTVAGIGAPILGSITGFIVGFALAHLPELINSATAMVFAKTKRNRILFAILGYSLWLGLGFVFWWECVRILCG